MGALITTLHAFDKSAGELGLDIEAHRALEKFLADGRARAIGVSNVGPDHLDRLLQESSRQSIPAANQIEVHPCFRQPDALAANAAHGILSQAWSPTGGITFCCVGVLARG